MCRAAHFFRAAGPDVPSADLDAVDEVVDTTDAYIPPPVWFDASDDAAAAAPASPVAVPVVPAVPRRRLFSHPRKGDFSYRPPPPPVAPPASEPDVPPKPKQTRFFSENGRFSRRRPDVSALDAIVRQHLGLPTPSPTLDDSGASGPNFFSDFQS